MISDRSEKRTLFYRSRYALALVGLLVCILAIIWLTQYFSQPVDTLILPEFEVSQKLEIPPRPGIQGIEISGPLIQPVTFAIDMSKPGLLRIDWDRLMAIDPGTDIKITTEINSRGQLTISNFDDGGHTQAGRYIRSALQTWMYKSYLAGTVRFWFNLPSRGTKVMVDISRLGRTAMVPAHVPVLYGRIHLIDNTPRGAVALARDF